MHNTSEKAEKQALLSKHGGRRVMHAGPRWDSAAITYVMF